MTEIDAERRFEQLTAGPAAHYPLYYFVPSHTADGRHMVVHREAGGDVQLHRLDAATGELTPITAGRSRDSGWAMWCERGMTGVYNHLSALNVSTGELWWFEDAGGRPGALELYAADVKTLARRRVLDLPGRVPIGQTAFSPDGRTFAYIHADSDAFRAALDRRGPWSAHEAWRQTVSCAIGLIDTATGEHRELVALPFHAHHVLFADDRHVLVNHAPDGNGMWVMPITGHLPKRPGDLRVLRPPDERGRVCHQVVTARGIDYEVFAKFDGRQVNYVGRHAWPGDTWHEVRLPAEGYAHTGFDPAGRLLICEVAGETHGLYALLHPLDDGRREFRRLRGLPPYPGHGQRFHAHPFLGPDRRWVYFTEAVDGVSQVCRLDIADLAARDGCGWPDETNHA